MAFGPAQPKFGHFSVTYLGLNGALSHAYAFKFGQPAAFGFRFTPVKDAALGPFTFSALGVNWTNPLSGHMFPVKPLPGTTGGGGGGGGTLGYGS